METVGYISSICTIVLFVFYIIGRFIIILNERKFIHERIIWYYSNEPDKEKKYNIQEHIILDGKSKTGLIITPNNSAIKRIKIYYYNNSLNKKGTLIIDKKIFLDSGYGIFIQTDNPELLVNYYMEFERLDGMICKFKIKSNSRNGISEELIECQHTCCSVIYYLLK